MKNILLYTILAAFLLSGCTSQQKLAYLNNLPETGGEEFFTMEIPDYKIQSRDVLYITVKAMVPDGSIRDFLSSTSGYQGIVTAQSESGGYLSGYEVNSEGNVILPVVGKITVNGITIDQARELLQEKLEKVFKDATVECKLLSYKYTVIGEVHLPGSYINYNSYLTVLEAIGRAGGIGDYGRRDKVLVVRPTEQGTRTYNLNLQDKNLLASEGYFLLPNDVVIVEPEKQKIFNLNLPTISFIVTAVSSAITTTLLLINYLGN